MTAAGARTPEELENLLEDAFVLRDTKALGRLFEVGAVLATADSLHEARGRYDIEDVAARLWKLRKVYVADSRRVLQAGDTALILCPEAVNVVRRGDEGTWRYTIAFMGTERDR